MTLNDILSICKAYTDLGSNVQEQLHSLSDGEADEDNTNPNAFKYIERFLKAVERVSSSDDDTDVDIAEVRAEMKKLEMPEQD